MTVVERFDRSAAAIADREFQIVREVVYKETGIKLTDSKRALVEARLGKRLRVHGMSSYGDYVHLLLGDDGAAELLELINAITTNKTSFFRESHHFDYLRNQLFPAAAGRELKIWSAGCSVGAEPYSIAITALDAKAPVRILATDIDTRVLSTAKAGIYEAKELSGLAPDTIRRHFVSVDEEKRGLFRAKPALRDVIDFQRLNLIARPWSVSEKFDVIFCRNVVIYFDRPTQRGLFTRFAEQLAPGGLLFLGHSENLVWMPEAWEACGRTTYRRRGGAASALELTVPHQKGTPTLLGARPRAQNAGAPCDKPTGDEAGPPDASDTALI
jgi:chemotaxis protein methyltransferase CheR